MGHIDLKIKAKIENISSHIWIYGPNYGVLSFIVPMTQQFFIAFKMIII